MTIENYQSLIIKAKNNTRKDSTAIEWLDDLMIDLDTGVYSSDQVSILRGYMRGLYSCNAIDYADFCDFDQLAGEFYD